MSFVDPDPMPRPYWLFFAGLIPLSVAMFLEALKLVNFHHWAGPILMGFIAAFVIWDAWARKPEASEPEE